MQKNTQKIDMLQRQKQKRHNLHLQRLQNISSPKRIKSKLQKHPTINWRHNNRLNLFESKRIETQNNRLCRRLSEINGRKNNFDSIGKQEEEYVRVIKKSRELYRKIRERDIQVENNNLVQRLLDKVGGSKSVIQQHLVSRNYKRSRQKSMLIPQFKTMELH